MEVELYLRKEKNETSILLLGLISYKSDKIY